MKMMPLALALPALALAACQQQPANEAAADNAAMMGAGQRVETDPELQALLREMRTEKQRLRHLPIAPMTFRGSRKSFGRSIVPRVSRICRNPSSAGW